MIESQASAHASCCAGVCNCVVIAEVSPPTSHANAHRPTDYLLITKSDARAMLGCLAASLCIPVAEHISRLTFQGVKVGTSREALHEEGTAAAHGCQRQPSTNVSASKFMFFALHWQLSWRSRCCSECSQLSRS